MLLGVERRRQDLNLEVLADRGCLVFFRDLRNTELCDAGNCVLIVLIAHSLLGVATNGLSRFVCDAGKRHSVGLLVGHS